MRVSCKEGATPVIVLQSMGRKGSSRQSSKADEDPVVDRLAAANAKSVLLGNLFSMGWRLAVTVLLPIYVGVQLDKRFDSAPSLSLAAFFIAIFAAGLLIYKTYQEMTADMLEQDGQASQRTKSNRSKDA